MADTTGRKRSGSVSITLETILSPALLKLGVSDDEKAQAAAVLLREAFENAERQAPGVAHDFVSTVLDKERVPFRTLKMKKSTNPVGTFSRESGSLVGDHSEEPSSAVATPTIANDASANDILTSVELSKLTELASTLCAVLEELPRYIGPEDDRLKFMGTVKQSAAAIKNLLDCLNEISRTTKAKSFVIEQKNEFVKVSKSFSDTLKLFFKGADASTVVTCASTLSESTTKILHNLSKDGAINV